jgi:phosphoglycolate phosphatase-like HAD superfamily hydrolase
MIQAVGFDLDDTLCVYIPVAVQARRQAFAELVQPLSGLDIETLDEAYQQAFWQMMEEIRHEPWRSRYLRSGEPTRTETMRRMLTALGLSPDGLAERLSARYLAGEPVATVRRRLAHLERPAWALSAFPHYEWTRLRAATRAAR